MSRYLSHARVGESDKIKKTATLHHKNKSSGSHLLGTMKASTKFSSSIFHSCGDILVKFVHRQTNIATLHGWKQKNNPRREFSNIQSFTQMFCSRAFQQWQQWKARVFVVSLLLLLFLLVSDPSRRFRCHLRVKVDGGEGTLPITARRANQKQDGVAPGKALVTMSCTDKMAKWVYNQPWKVCPDISSNIVFLVSGISVDSVIILIVLLCF